MFLTYTDQLQGDSPATELQPSTKKRMVVNTKGNLSIELCQNANGKTIYGLYYIASI